MIDPLDPASAFADFRDDLLREAEVSGDPQRAAFFRIYGEMAADNGDTADLVYTPASREGAKPYQVDGYAWDVERGELHLAVCDYNPEPDLQTVHADRIDHLFKRATRFCELSGDPAFVYSLEESSPAFELATLICQARDRLSRVRCTIFSNARLATRRKTLEAGTVLGAQITCNIIDFARYLDILGAQGGSEPIELDVRELNGKLLPCLEAHDGDSNCHSYLIVMPASLLARAYGLYGSRLMEQNVRTFLQARTKTNQGIINTASESPDMFFAYNNGITATAGGLDVETDEAGNRGIARIRNLQIVNGGQTTASLLYASDRGRADLSRVFVQMKLSVIAPERLDEVVPLISRYANTQNKVSEADFFSNHPFHVEMQKISRRLAAPVAAGSLSATKWFYERTRGQYRNDTAMRSAADKRRFEAEFPPSQVIQKTDAAKYHVSFIPEPHIVSLGAQKCFLEFAKEVGKRWEESRPSFNDTYFRDLVSKAIIFRWLDHSIGKAEWYKADRGYKANIVTYTLGWLVSHLRMANREIDFDRVWKLQDVPEELAECLNRLAPVIAAILKSPPATHSNVSEYAKTPLCWRRVMSEKFEMPASLRNATIDFVQAKARLRTSSAQGKMDIDIEFDRMLVERLPQILTLEAFALRRGMASPLSSRAMAKLKRGNIDLSAQERNALKHLFSRCDQLGHGPQSWD